VIGEVRINSGKDRTELQRLFAYINEARGIDFGLYRQATVIRKIELRLQNTKTYNYTQYIEYLKSHQAELDNLIKALTIKHSNFFRNPLVFELLDYFVLPDIISQFGFFSIWSLGCAKGEEPYSIAMIIRELFKKDKKHFDCRILGTDLCDEAVESAIKGEYPESEMSEVKKKYVDVFFQKVSRPPELPGEQGQIHRINNEIKSMVRFECHDIAGILKSGEKRPGTYNLILCRNVLIYMSRLLQEEILGNILSILAENGYFIIGESETIPDSFKDRFVQVFPGIKIYKKKPASKQDAK
jgi:chemotaxis methyl-accepting protein methylase